MSNRPWLGLVGLAATLLSLVPVLVEAGDGGVGQKEGSVHARRGEHATVTFGTDAAVRITLRGRVVDAASDRPLPITALKVVQFEIAGDEGAKEPVPLAALVSEVPPYSVRKSYPVTTTEQGRFVVAGLEPGHYSLQVEWHEVASEADVVRWDIEWVETEAQPQR